MKKVILSITLVAAGLIGVSNIQAANFLNEKASIVRIADQDDGFVDVKFEDLNEKVQTAIRGLIEEYELNALQYNAEKQVTKAQVTKKDDQSQNVFYFDAEGQAVTWDENPVENVGEVEEGMEQPSIEMSYVVQDEGFVEVRLEDLNEKVQAAVNALTEAYEIGAVKYNAEAQITKVKATSKEDQSERTFFFDNEGVETTYEKAEQVEETQSEETELF